MVVDLSPKAGVPWKDKLLRGKADGPSLNFGIINEEDLVFVEGDILRSTVNGIPAINFSDQIKDWLVKDMETTVVVKLLGLNMSYGVICGHYLTIQPGTVDFNPLKLFPSMVLAWIRFLGMTGFLYKRQVLEEICSLISKVARLDIKIGNGIRGRFARMVVFVDLEKSLVSQILVNRKVQRVKFEYLPAVCFSCGCYGHLKDFCLSIVLDPNSVGGKKQALFRSSKSLLW
ncbi:hypothetical protein Gogos_021601 [Gossypium gossypioides]|uniref:CCHC-type domain-containing protein n=1 Tax=Gossypium gossypioides TaxID=34282 RepID=A0A7J9CYS9_GOSGO|nr:hypothetical protein [Gossypium gossypioides]